MPITFPRDLIEPFTIRAGGFQLIRAMASDSTRGGLQQTVETARPLWQAKYQLPLQRESAAEAWASWLDSLRGGARHFKAWHPLRRHAINYPAGYGGMTRHGGGTFDGTATLSSILAGRDGGTLTTLPSTFVLLPGDLVSITAGSVQHLHRLTVGGTAAAGALAVEWEPDVPVGVTAPVTVTLLKPWFKARLDPGSVKIDWQAGRRAAVAFDAWQHLG